MRKRCELGPRPEEPAHAGVSKDGSLPVLARGHPSRRLLRKLLRMRSRTNAATFARPLTVRYAASRAAARPIASPRRAFVGAFLLMRASNSGGAVSGEPALNGGAGLYSSRN